MGNNVKYKFGKVMSELLMKGVQLKIDIPDNLKHIPDSLQLESRSQLPLLFNKLGLHGLGVEIGTQKGSYSIELLAHSNLKRLFSVDPWIEFPDEVYQDGANVSQKHQDFRYLVTVMRLMKFTTRSVVLRMLSADAANHFDEESLDMVYIDGDHSYKGCKEDIDLWFSKVKNGGIFAGHDYMNTKEFGVKRAVDEFVKDKKQKLFVTNASSGFDKDWPTWYVIKK